MMSIEDYAQDVGKTVEEIYSLCDKLGIAYKDSNTMLDDTAIILLDNKIQEEDNEPEVSLPEDAYEEELYEDEEAEEVAEELAYNTKIDLDNTESFTKVKKNNQPKKTENNKKDFLKERKKLYKHREKLQSNEATQDDNVVLYKEGMTVTELANLLKDYGFEDARRGQQYCGANGDADVVGLEGVHIECKRVEKLIR